LVQEIESKKSHGVDSLKALKTMLAQSCEMSARYIFIMFLLLTLFFRWGDNIYVVRAWIKQRFPQIAEADINTHFDMCVLKKILFVC
jgi:phosphoglycerate-specific signal transduction histidine kinase